MQPRQLGRFVGTRNFRPVANHLRVLELAPRVMVLRYKPALPYVGLQAKLRAIILLEGGPSGYPSYPLPQQKCRSPLLAKSGFIARAFFPKPVPGERARADQQMRVRIIFLPVDRPLHHHAMFLRLDFFRDEGEQQLAALLV